MPLPWLGFVVCVAHACSQCACPLLFSSSPEPLGELQPSPDVGLIQLVFLGEQPVTDFECTNGSCASEGI